MNKLTLEDICRETVRLTTSQEQLQRARAEEHARPLAGDPDTPDADPKGSNETVESR
jgi:hypothetical protein